MEKSATELYKALPEATRNSYDETVKALRRHHSEITVVFRRRLAHRVQHAGEKLADFLGSLQQLALKAHPDESQDIRNHLVLQGFFKGIHYNQIGFELRKTIGNKDMNIAKALGRLLHLEAVIRIEEEEQTPRIAAIRRD